MNYGRDVEGGVTFYSNRHSFVTRLIQVADVATMQSFSGHSDAELVAYSSHVSDESRKRTMENLLKT